MGDKKEEIKDSSNLKPYIIVIYDLKNLNTVKKIEVSHKLFGHAQTKNGKRYEFGGILKAMNGTKLGRGAVLVPKDCKDNLIRFLESYSIKYQIINIYKED